MKGKLREKIEAAVDDIKMSKFLATIRTDVPVDLNLDELKVVEPNPDKLTKLFNELEFKSLLDKFLNKGEKKQKSSNAQLSLFEEYTPDGQDLFENSTLEDIETHSHDYQLVDTEEGIIKLYELFNTKEIICLDTETTSTSTIDAELVGLSFAVEENKAYYVPIPSNREEALKILSFFKPIYENPEILKVGHNIKYD